MLIRFRLAVIKLCLHTNPPTLCPPHLPTTTPPPCPPETPAGPATAASAASPTCCPAPATCPAQTPACRRSRRPARRSLATTRTRRIGRCPSRRPRHRPFCRPAGPWTAGQIHCRRTLGGTRRHRSGQLRWWLLQGQLHGRDCPHLTRPWRGEGITADLLCLHPSHLLLLHNSSNQ